MAHYSVKVQPSSNKVTQAEFARVIGVQPQTVGEFKRDNRLAKEYSGGRDKVLVNESIDLLNKTMKMHGVFRDRQAEKDKIKTHVVQEPTESFEELNEEVSESQLDLDTQDADVLFKNAKALREKAAAMQGAADYEKSIGKLVDREVVDKIIFERARQFRDGLMTWKRRIAPELVGLDNIQEIESLLDRDIRFLLNEFSKMPVIE